MNTMREACTTIPTRMPPASSKDFGKLSNPSVNVKNVCHRYFLWKISCGVCPWQVFHATPIFASNLTLPLSVDRFLVEISQPALV